MKNLKMFAIAVMAFAVMATGVHAASCAAGQKFSIMDSNDTLTCYANLDAALGAANDGATIKLEEAYQGTVSTAVTKNITIDLNGKNIKITGAYGIEVNGAGKKLTLKGTGTIENTNSADKSLITVDAGASLEVLDSVKLVNNEKSVNDAAAVLVKSNAAGTNKTTVKFEEGVTVTSLLHGLVVGDSGHTNAKNTEITMNGTWTAEAYVVKVNGFIAYEQTNPVKVNVPAGTYTSNGATALYASGYAEWSIKNPTVKGAQAVTVRSGNVNIENGTYEATAVANSKGAHDGDTNYAIAVLGTEAVAGNSAYNSGNHIDVTIAKGTFTATGKDAYAIYVGDVTGTDKLTINGGSFTSGTDSEDGSQLPAMLISKASLDDIFSTGNVMVTNGSFVGGLVGEVTTDDGVKYSSEEFTAELVNGEISTPEAQKPADEGQQPGATEPGDQTTGDGNQGGTENVKNPETNDNILVYAGLGLVSLASVAFTAKKRED